MRLDKKVAIVTGGGKGIGRHYALALAREGAAVTVADIDGAATVSTAQEITTAGGRALALEIDVSSEDSTLRMAEETARAFGGIDVLVNNAALMSALPRSSWLEIPVEEWDRVMGVNMRGVFLCSRAVFPYMKERGGGSIINISSSRVWSGRPDRLHYTASKMGVIGITRSLSREVGEFNIRVNAVTPGQTASETQVATTDPERLAARVKERALKRIQTPEDLVGTIVFLASDESAFITGQTINVDGGQAMH